MVGNDECEQVKICEKIFEGIDEKIKVANHRIDDLENKSEEINSINKVLVELQLLTKLQREDGVKRDMAIENMNKNQEEMNKNQIEITNTLKTLAVNLGQTDTNVDKLDKKVDNLDKKIDSVSDKDKISLIDLGKKILYGSILAGAGVVGTLIVTKLFS